MGLKYYCHFFVVILNVLLGSGTIRISAFDLVFMLQYQVYLLLSEQKCNHRLFRRSRIIRQTFKMFLFIFTNNC